MVVNSSRRRVYAPRPFQVKRGDASAQRMKITKRLSLPVKSSGTVKQQVKSLAKAVRARNPEIKYIDITCSVTNVVVATGDVVELTAIPAGTDQSQRISDAIRIKSLSLSGAMAGAWETTSQTLGARIAVVQDMQQITDTDITVGDVFSSVDPIVTFLNLNSLGRYKVLYLSKVFFGLPMIAGEGNQLPMFEWNWTGDIPVRYNGTAATDIQKNGIFFMIFGNNAGATGDVSAICRVGFTDS